MPRGPRRARVESPELDALDAVVREYDAAQAALDRLREEMQEAAVRAARTGRVKVAEVARRTGYSREYMSRLIAEANKRDGWTPPADDANEAIDA